jgi:hypothetical protein
MKIIQAAVMATVAYILVVGAVNLEDIRSPKLDCNICG